MKETRYNERVWLNDKDSDSTGSIVAFDGVITTKGGDNIEWTFLEVSDCYGKVRLHKSTDDSKEDFLNKLKLLKKEIDSFISFLEE